MNRFFRENLVGVLALSAAGSLVATGLVRFIPTPTDGGTGLIEVVSRQIPVWTLFPYSVLLVLAFALRALRTRHAEQSALKDAIAAVRGERDAVRQQLEGLTKECQGLRQQLADTRSSTVSQPDLMRFVAVGLSTSQGNPSNPITHEYVGKHVAGLAGQGIPHASVGEALGSMLHIGAVVSSHSGLILDRDWKDKMRAAGVPDVLHAAG